MIKGQGWLSDTLYRFRRRTRRLTIPPMIKLGALVALGVAPFLFFVFLQADDPGNTPEPPSTQPIGGERIRLAFPFGTPEPSTAPSPPTDPNATTTQPAGVQCADGRDNDLDGRVDMADSGCSSRRDNNEAQATTTTRPPARATTTVRPATTQPPTTAPPATTAPPTTTSPPQPTQPATTAVRVQGECSDGIDNDGDGETDLEDRASCHGDPAEDE